MSKAKSVKVITNFELPKSQKPYQPKTQAPVNLKDVRTNLETHQKSLKKEPKWSK